MKKSRFTESQIVAAIKKQESGVSARELCRELGISEATFYNWKARYGGMEVSDVKRMKEMEAELSQYKKISSPQSVLFKNLALAIPRKCLSPEDFAAGVLHLLRL